MKIHLLFPVLLFLGCNPSPKKACNETNNNPITSFKTQILSPKEIQILKTINPEKLFFSPEDGSFFFTDTANNLFYLKNNSFLNLFSKKLIENINSNVLFKTPKNFIVYNKKLQQGRLIEKQSDKFKLSAGALNIVYPIPTEYYNMDKNQTVLIERKGELNFLFNYGVWEKKNINYLDTNIFFFITSKHKINKIGKYPELFFNNYVHLREAQYAIDSNNFIYYIHTSFDSIYKIDYDGKILNAGEIHSCPTMSKYEEKDLTNLTYLRNYLATTESNVSILVVKNKYIVTLKKLAQKKVTDKPLYKYFVFSQNLDKIYNDTIRSYIFPKLLEYKDGFFLITETADKILEYEIQ